MTTFVIIGLSLALGIVSTMLAVRMLRKSGDTHISSHLIAERIRSVGKLVGLEVLSKEIVTQTRGLNWLPPLLLSQARLAMIFSFEKRYYIDLARLQASDVHVLGEGRYRITLPAIEDSVHLLDVTPYDIQSGKLLGLLDVFRMDAQTQKDLMTKAQSEATALYEAHGQRYEDEARRAIRTQVRSLLSLFDVELDVRFADEGRDEDGSDSKDVAGKIGIVAA